MYYNFTYKRTNVSRASGMKTILHCDLNNFFASVECRNNPHLKDFPIAVCGSVEERKGIVLAKNELAKAFGVKTGEAIWQAKRKCPALLTVPPHFKAYKEASARAFEIYTRFTDRIEPFGIDECWLDVTGSERLFGSGEEIAYKIKETVKSEMGITLSVGVSFNKVFAKLGSDMKKPDAVTVISAEDFREKVWGLPVNDMIGIGRATFKKLQSYYIRTIGDLANTDEDFIRRLLGVNGVYCRQAARGEGNDEVCMQDFQREIKSVGNSTTCVRDLRTNGEVWRVMLELSRSVCKRLRSAGLAATGVQISIKTNDLETVQFQAQVGESVQASLRLAEEGFELFLKHFTWELPVRAVGICGINLVSADGGHQQSLFEDTARLERRERTEKVIDELENRFGDGIVVPLSLKIPLNIPEQENKPGFFH